MTLTNSDPVGPDFTAVAKLSRIIHSSKTKFQDLVVAESKLFGKILYLDGDIQLSERDECIYHDMLVHPALTTHPKPKKVLIMGGGEGFALRDALKHSCVEKVVVCDLDDGVVHAAKEYFGIRTFEDPRSELIVDDARKYVERTKEKFDVVISDLTVLSGPAKMLYTQDFYRMVKEKMTPGGIFVTHCETPYFYPHVTVSITRTLASVFKHVRKYRAYVPAYAGEWFFALASDSDPTISAAEVRKRLDERKVKGLKYYSPEIHEFSFVIPKYLQDIMDKEKGVISTDAKPLEHEKTTYL